MGESMDEGVKMNGNGSSVPTIGRTRTPKVSIGLPVYNGERYLRESIESVLAQDFEDFELLISDNASTDGTWEICTEYAARDRRIRLHRNPRNLGAAANFRLVFQHTSAPYFMWWAHDDIMESVYVKTCHEFLQGNPEYVHCCTRAYYITENGIPQYGFLGEWSIDQDDPADRLRYVLDTPPMPVAIYGLMRRTEGIRALRAMRPVLGADYLFLAALALLGRFHQSREPLYLRRERVPTRSINETISRQQKAMHAIVGPAGVVLAPNLRFALAMAALPFRGELPLTTALSLLVRVLFRRIIKGVYWDILLLFNQRGHIKLVSQLHRSLCTARAYVRRMADYRF